MILDMRMNHQLCILDIWSINEYGNNTHINWLNPYLQIFLSWRDCKYYRTFCKTTKQINIIISVQNNLEISFLHNNYYINHVCLFVCWNDILFLFFLKGNYIHITNCKQNSLLIQEMNPQYCELNFMNQRTKQCLRKW